MQCATVVDENDEHLDIQQQKIDHIDEIDEMRISLDEREFDDVEDVVLAMFLTAQFDVLDVIDDCVVDDDDEVRECHSQVIDLFQQMYHLFIDVIEVDTIDELDDKSHKQVQIIIVFWRVRDDDDDDDDFEREIDEIDDDEQHSIQIVRILVE